jgi:hypothetical protein
VKRRVLLPVFRSRRLRPTKRGVPGPGQVRLEVMNPRSNLVPRPILEPAPRLTDLSRKKIGIYWNGKAGADNLLGIVAELLQAKYPSSTILRYEGPLDAGDERATAMCSDADTIIYGVGD